MNFLHKLNPRNSLRAQISLVSGLMTLLLSLILSYFAAASSQHQIERNEGESFVRRAQNALEVMDRGMFERSREIRNAAILEDIREPNVPIARKREILERLQSTFNAYAWIGICDAQGIGSVGTGKYLEGKDLSKRPWCSKGRDKPYIGDVHDALLLAKLLPNPDGQPFYLVDVAAPVIDRRGVLQGVLCGHIYWKWAEEALDSKRTPGKDILLLSRDGLLLSGPEKQRSDLAKFAPATMRAIRQDTTGGGYLLEKWSDGKTYLVGYAKSSGYRDYPGLGWVSLVRQDVTEAFAPANQLRHRILLIGAMLGVLFAWMGWLLAGRIALPIVLISQAAGKVAAGDLNQVIPVQQGDGEVAHLSAAIHDMVNKLTGEIIQRQKAEENLKLSAQVFESNTEAILITNASNEIVRVNRAFTEITGYAAEEVIGKNPHILSSGHHDAGFYAAMWATLLSTGSWSGEIWNRRKGGEIYPEHLTLVTLKNADGVVTNHVASFTDITLRKQAEEKIRTLAFYDSLTGLPNRSLLLDRIQQALASCARSHHHAALLFIDLDNFKLLNDTRGHYIGDLLLKQVAQRLKGCVREGDTIARLGGDEFVVILEDLHEQAIEAAQQTESIGEKVLNMLRMPYHLADQEYLGTPSIGATVFNRELPSLEEIMKQGDFAMYQAKKAGRNALRFFDPVIQSTVAAHAILESELRIAVSKQDQLQLHYQLQVDASGAPLGAEALVRWRHPQRGMISPAEFIPLAEESGLILPLGHWVLMTACQQLAEWSKKPETRGLSLAANISAKQFGLVTFVEED